MVERARVAVALVFALNGLVFASWVSRLPAVREALGLSTGQLGLLLLCVSVGSVDQITLPLTFKCGTMPEIKTTLRTWIKPAVVVYTCGQDAARYPVQAAYCAR